MRLLMIANLNEISAELAEALCTDNSVTVWHPNPWPLESRFRDACVTPRELAMADLSAFDAVTYLSLGALDITYLESLLERLRTAQIPCICLEPRAVTQRQGTPLSAEQSLCRLYQQEYALPVSWVSIPALYGDDVLPDEWMHRLLKRSRNNIIELQGAPEDVCDLLHASDAASLIQHLLKETTLPATLTLSSGCGNDLNSIADVFRSHFRLSDVRTVAPVSPAATMPIDAYPVWTPHHALMQDLPQVLLQIEELSVLDHNRRRALRFASLRRLALFLLLFACVCLYTGFIQVSAELQFVDVRLLFVIGSSLYMGRGYGIAASLCSSVVSVVQALSAGTRWHTIFFHIDNWIPIAVYLAVAILFGLYQENRVLREDGAEKP